MPYIIDQAKEFDKSHPYIPEAEIARRRKAREEERAKEKAAGTVSSRDHSFFLMFSFFSSR